MAAAAARLVDEVCAVLLYGVGAKSPTLRTRELRRLLHLTPGVLGGEQARCRLSAGVAFALTKICVR